MFVTTNDTLDPRKVVPFSVTFRPIYYLHLLCTKTKYTRHKSRQTTYSSQDVWIFSNNYSANILFEPPNLWTSMNWGFSFQLIANFRAFCNPQRGLKVY